MYYIIIKVLGLQIPPVEVGGNALTIYTEPTLPDVPEPAITKEEREACPMSTMDAEEIYTMGMETLNNGDTGAALELLEKAVSLTL